MHTPAAEEIAALSGQTLSPEERASAMEALRAGLGAGLYEANRRDAEAWARVRTVADWEAFRDARLAALRASLGPFPEAGPLNVRCTGVLAGGGYRVEKLLYDARPGLVVTAHLYAPEPAGGSMPGIVVCHSHHNPKHQEELQDIGANFARAGCLVLVPDQIGHGERRQHPFAGEGDWPAPFQVGRQDCYFRYTTGMQLHLAGESLIGWMVWELMRGVDLLLARPGIDPARILLLGAVAGGGDPVAVAAALDRRVACAVPYNLGAPESHCPYPAPPGALGQPRHTASPSSAAGLETGAA